jgi:hypothetical protein
MSEQINKVLADRPQSFSSAEQAQARANIGAMAASASSQFAPASAGFSGVSANNYITGDGTSASPLGLSSRARFENSLSATVIGPNQVDVHNHVGTSYIGNSFLSLNSRLGGGVTSYMNASSLRFTDSADNTEQVDASSIQRWNSYSSMTGGLTGVSTTTPNVTGDGTTANPVGLGSSIIFESGDSANSIGRRGMTVSTTNNTAWYYGAFASFEKSDASANYRANEAQFKSGSLDEVVNAQSIYSWNHPQYFCIIKHPAANTTIYLSQDSYPTGLTADARLDILNLGATSAGYNYVVYESDSFHGSTSTLTALESATLWWDNTDQIWTTRGKLNP